MNNTDKQYLELLKHILVNGVKKSDRTGTGTISVFDYTMRFNMDEGFPLLTSKKMFTKGIIHELIWFLKGDTNIKYLIDNDVHIWDGDAYKNYLNNFTPPECPPHMDVEPNFYEPMSKEMFIKAIQDNSSRGIEFSKKWGELGPVYGKQWRYIKKPIYEYGNYVSHDRIDQISNLIRDLKETPDSRRLMVSAWSVSEIEDMVLPPCHYGFQCYTQEMSLEDRIERWCTSLNKSISYGEDMTHEKLDKINFPKRKLSLKWTQRSVDVFLGLGFNITSYSILLHLLSKDVNMIPGELIFSGGDCHIYLNHIEQAKEQLKRETFDLPKLVLKNESIDNLRYEDIEIINYRSSGILKAELSN
jgi:thymidylate synthase